jgi:hypothetical protein
LLKLHPSFLPQLATLRQDFQRLAWFGGRGSSSALPVVEQPTDRLNLVGQGEHFPPQQGRAALNGGYIMAKKKKTSCCSKGKKDADKRCKKCPKG